MWCWCLWMEIGHTVSLRPFLDSVNPRQRPGASTSTISKRWSLRCLQTVLLQSQYIYGGFSTRRQGARQGHKTNTKKSFERLDRTEMSKSPPFSCVRNSKPVVSLNYLTVKILFLSQTHFGSWGENVEGEIQKLSSSSCVPTNIFWRFEEVWIRPASIMVLRHAVQNELQIKRPFWCTHHFPSTT